MGDDIVAELEKGIAGITQFFKDDDNKIDRPFVNVQKAAVLLKARDFHNDKLVREDPESCLTTIVQILCLLNSAEPNDHLNAFEATEIFFGITKLFVSQSATLRRMVYVILKEIYSLCDPADVIIVTSCLTKDMTSSNDVHKSNALRVLVRIIDTSMLSAIERYIKQAIIDKSHLVSSSAIVSSLHLFQTSTDHASIIKRWVREVQEALKSQNEMVQFHATLLFYQIKANDRLAISKFVQKYSAVNTKIGRGIASPNNTSQYDIKSPLAICSFIRYAAKLLHEEVHEGRAGTDSSIMNASEICKVCYDFLVRMLRHESDMVAFEAARAICSLPTQAPEVIAPCLSVLQISLCSQKPTSKLATVKLLFGISKIHPNLIARFNEDLEALIGDSNRLIGSLSIMTLLKTCSESSIDRLLKYISSFLHHIAEEYKIMLVKSLQSLCVQYPSKYNVIIGFLAKFLREEGGYSFKQTIVIGMISLMEQIPETRELVLFHLCEFIEDCEHVRLSSQILHILGDMGPKSESPARFVRFIYNRCILENAMIRASAVSSLSKFGASCPSLRKSIISLLQTCQNDENDETRDRATLAISILNYEEEQLATDDAGKSSEMENAQTYVSDSLSILTGKLPFSFDNLQHRLNAYLSTPGNMDDSEPLTIDVLPIVEEDNSPLIKVSGSIDNDQDIIIEQVQSAEQFSTTTKPQRPDLSAAIYAIPELNALGRVFRSTQSVALTEMEAEYVVHCIKHIFSNHVVLQFLVQNTIEDQVMKNVHIAIDADSALFSVIGEIPATNISHGASASCFSILERDVDSPITSAEFHCELKFSVIQIDTSTGEEEGEPYDDEYPIDAVELLPSDYIIKTTSMDFRKDWDELGNEHEILQKYGLQEKSIDGAAQAVIKCMHMQTCDGTGTINPSATQHMLHLSGTFMGGVKTLVRCQLSLLPTGGVVLKMAIRAETQEAAQLLSQCMV
jgi:coatomer subunit gamma